MPDSDLKNFGEILGLIYDAAGDIKGWRRALDAVRTAIQAQAAIAILAPDSANQEGLTFVLTKEFFETREFSKFVEASWPFPSIPGEGVATIQDLTSEEDWKVSDFYLNVIKPQRIGDMLCIDLRMDDGAASMLRFTRHEDAPPFGREERELARMLAPHLKRALRLDRELALHQVIHRRYADACDRLGLAAFLLDRSGCVLEKNALAEELLRPADALVLRNGRLAARDPAEDRKLQQAIRDTRNGGASAKPGQRPIVLSAQRPDACSLGVLVQRITDSETVRTGRRKPTTIVFVRDPEAQVGECADAAQRLFNLTQTEAALVMRLANGLSLIEAAQDMQIRHTTARTHLRSIFAKTGLTRQSSLVRQVLNSVTPLTRNEPDALGGRQARQLT